MNTSDEPNEIEETTETNEVNPEEQKPIKQKRVHGQMQLRVFEKMGIVLRVQNYGSQMSHVKISLSHEKH